MSWSHGAVCPGGARVRFVHFWCPRFVTLANVEYLEVLLDLKIKFAGAIETKKYETNPMGSRSQKQNTTKKSIFFKNEGCGLHNF